MSMVALRRLAALAAIGSGLAGIGYAAAALAATFDPAIIAEQKITENSGGFTGTLDPDDQFGRPPSNIGDLDGDGVNDLAGYVSNDDDGGFDRGALWILFMKSDGTVKAQQKISSTSGGFVGPLGNGDVFGNAVGLGDLDGDGIIDLAVGAETNDDGGGNHGAVFILFMKVDGTVKAEQKISDTQGNFTAVLDDGDQFGTSIASLGDVDGDGVADLAVGAIFDDDGLVNAGAVYILFLNTDGTVKAHQKISATQGGFTGVLDIGDGFGGRQMAGVGDLDGDGVPDLGVGVAEDDDGGTNRGAVWLLFLNANGTVKSHAKISSTAGGFAGPLDDNDLFGFSIANIGDVDGDGVVDLAVGAAFDDDGGSNKGAVWLLFLNTDGTVKAQHKISSTSGGLTGPIDTEDRFGSGVAGPGDLDGNGVNDLVVGAAFDDDAGADAGTLWVLFLGNAAEPAIVASAGPDQTVEEGDLVGLNGSGSLEVGANLNCTWSQIAGPTVVFVPPTGACAIEFTAPYVGANTTLSFELIVDDGTRFSEPDAVDITVVNVNTPPVADAGDDGTIKEGALGTLNGLNSFDPEADPIAYSWTLLAGPPTALVPSNTVAQPSFTAPLAAGQSLTFGLQVSDGKESSTPSPYPPDPGISDDDIVSVLIVANSRPTADAGDHQTNSEGSAVTLDGTASFDPDGGDTITYQWTQTAGTAVTLSDPSSVAPGFTAPAVAPGGVELVFTLVVRDDDPVNPLASEPDEVRVTVVNVNDPPRCDLAVAEPADLWPPNHKLRQVAINDVADAGDAYTDVVLTVTGVTQDEPTGGLGDGDSSPDAVLQAGEAGTSVLLRAERAGTGNGRVYRVAFTADDGFESCTGTVEVTVPPSRAGTAIDDGQDYNATLP